MTTANRGVINLAEQISVKWSKRHKPSLQLQESFEQRKLVFSTIFDDIDGDEEIQQQVQMSDPIAYSASSDPDTMYMDQAMKQPDRKQFIKAMVDEVAAHTNNGHWKLLLKSDVPTGIKILPSVWAMKRKRRIATQQVYKWKARLNIHGGKQEYGVNYWETYAATLAWPPICFMLTLSIIKSWHTWQIDFTLAYPQADVECDLYMELPKGFEVKANSNHHCLQIIKNIYGQKQAGRTWALHLKRGLLSIGFVQSLADDCIFYKGTTIFMVYVDDGIFLGPKEKEINECIQDMKGIFKLTNKGDISDYPGSKVTKLTNSHILLTQSHLIDRIITDLNFAKNTKAKDIPAVSASILQRETLTVNLLKSTGISVLLLGNSIFLKNPLDQTLPTQFINVPAFQQHLKNPMLSLYGRLSGISSAQKIKE